MPGLAEAVENLMTIVPSEATCERMFSYQKLAHTPNRNGMLPELIEAECQIRATPIEAVDGVVVKKKRVEDAPETANQRVLFNEAIEHTVAMTALNLYLIKKRWDVVKAKPKLDITYKGPNGNSGIMLQVKKIRIEKGFAIELGPASGGTTYCLMISNVDCPPWVIGTGNRLGESLLH